MNITNTYKKRPEITQVLSLSIEKHINPNNDTSLKFYSVTYLVIYISFIYVVLSFS